MVNTKIASLTLSLAALPACSEWRTFRLEQPATRQVAVCATDWGTLNDEWNQRLHQCIATCESKGFVLTSPESMPRAGPPVANAAPPSIPNVCR